MVEAPVVAVAVWVVVTGTTRAPAGGHACVRVHLGRRRLERRVRHAGDVVRELLTDAVKVVARVLE